MKLAILIGAALLGTTAVAAAPAGAQRYGWNDRYDRHDGYGRYGRYDRYDRYDRRDRWRDGRRWDRGGWNRGWRGGRSRLVCRTYRDYYGPVRRCFRVHR